MGGIQLKYIKTEKRKDIKILRISKPEVLNALDSEVLSELEEAVDAIIKDETIRALIITGEGRCLLYTSRCV